MRFNISSHSLRVAWRGSMRAIIGVKVATHGWCTLDGPHRLLLVQLVALSVSYQALGALYLRSLKLTILKLHANRFIDMCCCCGFLELFKLGKISLFFANLHAIGCRELCLILLFQFIDSVWLNTLWRCQMEVSFDASSSLNEAWDVLLDERHAKNIDDVWPFLLILNQ